MYLTFLIRIYLIYLILDTIDSEMQRPKVFASSDCQPAIKHIFFSLLTL